MSWGLTPALAMASLQLFAVACQTEFMSCSAQPGCRWMISAGEAALAISFPARSNTTVFITVVPASMPIR